MGCCTSKKVEAIDKGSAPTQSPKHGSYNSTPRSEKERRSVNIAILPTGVLEIVEQPDPANIGSIPEISDSSDDADMSVCKMEGCDKSKKIRRKYCRFHNVQKKDKRDKKNESVYSQVDEESLAHTRKRSNSKSRSKSRKSVAKCDLHYRPLPTAPAIVIEGGSSQTQDSSDTSPKKRPGRSQSAFASFSGKKSKRKNISLSTAVPHKKNPPTPKKKKLPPRPKYSPPTSPQRKSQGLAAAVNDIDFPHLQHQNSDSLSAKDKVELLGTLSNKSPKKRSAKTRWALVRSKIKPPPQFEEKSLTPDERPKINKEFQRELSCLVKEPDLAKTPTAERKENPIQTELETVKLRPVDANAQKRSVIRQDTAPAGSLQFKCQKKLCRTDTAPAGSLNTENDESKRRKKKKRRKFSKSSSPRRVKTAVSPQRSKSEGRKSKRRHCRNKSSSGLGSPKRSLKKKKRRNKVGSDEYEYEGSSNVHDLSDLPDLDASLPYLEVQILESSSDSDSEERRFLSFQQLHDQRKKQAHETVPEDRGSKAADTETSEEKMKILDTVPEDSQVVVRAHRRVASLDQKDTSLQASGSRIPDG